MADVFIGYKREDRERVEAVVQGLTQLGISVAWDQKIPPGQTWASWIGAQIRDARIVVVCWSKRTEDPSQASWVLDEAKASQQMGKSVMPVMLERCTVPLGWGQMQAADLSDWNGAMDHPEWDDFVTEVRRLLALPDQQTATQQPAAQAAPAPAFAAPRVQPTAKPQQRALPTRMLAMVGGGLAALAVVAAAAYFFVLCPARLSPATSSWTAENVVSERGRWTAQAPSSDKAPCNCIGGLFMYVGGSGEAVAGGDDIAAGAVVRGVAWRPDGKLDVNVVYGRTARPERAITVSRDQLTYLGGSWRAELQSLSDALFARQNVFDRERFPYTCAARSMNACEGGWTYAALRNSSGAWLDPRLLMLSMSGELDSSDLEFMSRIVGTYFIQTRDYGEYAAGSIFVGTVWDTEGQNARVQLVHGRTNNREEEVSIPPPPYLAILGRSWQDSFIELSDTVADEADSTANNFAYRCQHADRGCRWTDNPNYYAAATEAPAAEYYEAPAEAAPADPAAAPTTP